MSLLSVIIPIYNGSEYICDTIKMVLGSDYKKLEVIAVNDGSTDDSGQKVEALSKEDSRVKLFTKKNGGVVTSRNYGVEHANGEYIAFVDQDDFVKSFMYSKLIAKMEADKSDMAMCSTGRNIKGNESGYDYLEDGTYTGEEIRKNLLYPMLFNGYDVPVEHAGGNHYPNIWCCVFKKSFWTENNIKFRAYINFEDDLLVKIETLSKAYKVSTISDIGYCWRVNLQSETYAHHFVEGIGRKQDLEYKDMENSIKIFCPSEDFLKVFKQVTYCKQYLDAVHYLTSPEAPKDKEFIKTYFEENIYKRDFAAAIEGRKFLAKGRVKPKFLLPLLAQKKSLTCYKRELFLDKVLLMSLKSKSLTKLERSLKK